MKSAFCLLPPLFCALACASACSGGIPTPAAEARPAADETQTLDVLFSPAVFRDGATLDLNVGEAQREGDLIATPIEFTSFRWEGETWRHRAVWFRRAAGDDPAGAPLSAVVDREGLARAAAADGVPALWIRDGFPGSRYGIDSTALMQYSLKRYYKTGDGRWVGFLWLARVFVRGTTVVGQLPGGSERVAISGCSKRGVASWIAAGVDDRIVGAMPTCWNGAGGEDWLRLKAERWGESHDSQSGGHARGPGFRSAKEQIRLIRGPQGQRLLEWTDPTLYPDRLASKSFVIAVGSSDPLYPVMSDGVYLARLPRDTRMALIPNARHRVVKTHEAAWRLLLDRLGHADARERLPEIVATIDESTGRIAARLEPGGTTETESEWTLWHAEDPSGSYLDVHWAGVPMQRDGERLSASLPPTDAAYQGWFLAYRRSDGRGYLTTPFRERRETASSVDGVGR